MVYFDRLVTKAVDDFRINSMIDSMISVWIVVKIVQVCCSTVAVKILTFTFPSPTGKRITPSYIQRRISCNQESVCKLMFYEHSLFYKTL